MTSRPKTPTLEPLLSIKRTADHYDVPEKTVRRWIDNGELPAVKLSGQWRIRPRDLEMFVFERLQR